MNTIQGELATMEEGQKLAQQALENRIKVEAIREAEDRLRIYERDESYRIKYDIYQPQIRELERHRDDEIEALYADIVGQITSKQVEATELMIVIKHVSRIMDYLRLDPKADIELRNVRVYRDQHLEDLGYLFVDKCLKVKLFIAENRKPVNKYQLVAIGKCLFYEDLLKLPRSYGTDINVDGYPQLEMVLKEGPRIDALKDWLNKNRALLLKDELAKYQAVKAEYEQAVQNYKPEDFLQLYKYVCPECGYFHHIFESYSWREPMECPRDRVVMVATVPATS